MWSVYDDAVLQDYDPLGCGRVSAQQFARALDAAGLRAALSAADARRLARCYADAADPARVCWRTFEDDCDQGVPAPTRVPAA